MTKLCSGQENPDAAADDDTADESNPYMLPFQATQNLNVFLYQSLRHVTFIILFYNVTCYTLIHYLTG